MSVNLKCLLGGYVFRGKINICFNLNIKWILYCYFSLVLVLVFGRNIVYVFFLEI